LDLVCLDTHILIWGIKEEASPERVEMIPRAKYLFSEFTKAHTKALIPSVVIGEFLLRIPASMHITVLNLMREIFITAPYDLQAAARFASLWQERSANNLIKDLQDELQATRAELRADCMIVATAITHKASCIYSHDRKLKAFAGNAISVIELPREQDQLNMKFSS
jgi:predicted nucleic acid-binding protein